MKLISLNTWGGRAGKEKLLQFVERRKVDTDIFCFQEIWSAPHEHLEGVSAGGRKLDHAEVLTEGLQEFSRILENHEPFFAPHFGDNYGLLLFTKKNIEVKERGELFVYREHRHEKIESGDIGNHARNIQYAHIQKNGHTFTIINFHGLWNGRGKTDSPERITQSEKIVAYIKSLKNPVIFAGDFNLLPDTESIKIIERAGLRNLIAEYGITSTRSNFYTKPEKFADYVFVSPEIRVHNFSALPDEVSDHLPLELDFEI